MPDSNGFPTVAECLEYAEMVTEQVMTDVITREVGNLLSATIADFESPRTRDGKGGTGRSFRQVEETRRFDGNNRQELLVHDLIPTEEIIVTVNGVQLADVKVRQPEPFRPHNILYREQNNVATIMALMPQSWVAEPDIVHPRPYPPRLFPAGLQNIAVQATWGNPVTTDIYHAIRGMVRYALLVGGVVGINGVGEEIQIDGFQTSTAVGAMNWQLSSPIAMDKNAYEECKAKYRVRPPRRFQRARPEMI